MKKKCDYILLIMNCKNYKHKALQQKNTWLKYLPNYIKYFHVIGDKTLCENNETEYIINNDENILYVNTKDDYNSLPSKVIQSFNVINKEYEYKYIFKTDDDQMLTQPTFFDTFIKLLASRNPITYYGGFSISVKSHISSYYMEHDCLPRDLLLEETTYCNGRFYLLHCKAVENLLTKKDEISKKYIEDHAIGYFLDNSFKENLLHFDNKKMFTDLPIQSHSGK